MMSQVLIAKIHCVLLANQNDSNLVTLALMFIAFHFSLIPDTQPQIPLLEDQSVH